jgi:uridylate kinase
MIPKRRILLKLTGEAFLSTLNHELSPILIKKVFAQIKALQSSIQFGIVVGGGNFFRGKEHGARMDITPAIGHQIGLLATMMNGLVVKDLLEQQDVPTSLFSAVSCPEIASPLSQQGMDKALAQGHTLVFAGGTGNPFFSTDTTAVLRGLQIKAQEIWKATNIDGIYTADPKKNPLAERLPHVTFDYALEHKLKIMDTTAYVIAAENNLPIRVFSIFEPQALMHAAEEKKFGSIMNSSLY